MVSERSTVGIGGDVNPLGSGQEAGDQFPLLFSLTICGRGSVLVSTAFSGVHPQDDGVMAGRLLRPPSQDRERWGGLNR